MLKKVSFIVLVTALFSLATNGMTTSICRMKDGCSIRYGTWTSIGEKKRKVDILLLQGRASFIEKNLDFIRELNHLGFTVYSFDWRGMGGSDRILDHPQKNHISSFDVYLEDLDAFVRNVIRPEETGRDLVLFGSSMGGHLALRYVAEYPGKVKGAVLAAPMLDIHTSPFPKTITPLMVRMVCALGFGDCYAFGYGNFDPSRARFSPKSETQDEKTFWKTIETIKQHPEYVTGGPTFSWVDSSFESMKKTRDGRYLSKIQEPVFLMTAGNDKVVPNAHDGDVCKMIPKCIHKLYEGASHNLMKERDSLRTIVLNDLNAFISNTIEKHNP